MEQKEIIAHTSKAARLKWYLENKERVEVLLLDLLRNNELSQRDYEKMIQDSEQTYKEFLKNLRQTPIDENQLQIPFEE